MGFGKFSTKKYAAREIKSQMTGKIVPIPSQTRVRFTSSQDFKNIINNKITNSK